VPLSVLGTSSQAWVLAAAASANAGQSVTLVAADQAGRRELRTSGLGLDGIAVVEVVATPDSSGPVLVAAASVAEVRRLAGSMALTGRDVLLVPSGAAGALSLCASNGPLAGAINHVFEAPGFPYLGAIEDDAVRFSARKDRLSIGGADPSVTAALVAELRPYLPGVVATALLETSLANTNAIIHPALSLANLSRIESGVPFRFYREGLSSAAVDLVLAVDRERLSVLTALGLPQVSISDWFVRFYGTQGLRGSTLLEQLSTYPALADSQAPQTLDHRYLVDDVRFGIAAYESLAALLEFSTPAISSIATLLSIATQQDLRDQAPVLADRLFAYHEAGSALSAITA
jgi:opine dehydrogenase